MVLIYANQRVRWFFSVLFVVGVEFIVEIKRQSKNPIKNKYRPDRYGTDPYGRTELDQRTPYVRTEREAGRLIALDFAFLLDFFLQNRESILGVGGETYRRDYCLSE